MEAFDNRFADAEHGYSAAMHPSGHDADDAIRLALAMVRAEWQGDPESWNQLYAVCDDPAELARQLTHLCRQTLDQLAGVAGVSSGEMLHRLASRLIPRPETGHVTMVDLRRLNAGNDYDNG
jgi:metal-dependent amidase/aminoacylase/carboxypeptidase family protein